MWCHWPVTWRVNGRKHRMFQQQTASVSPCDQGPFPQCSALLIRFLSVDSCWLDRRQRQRQVDTDILMHKTGLNYNTDCPIHMLNLYKWVYSFILDFSDPVFDSFEIIGKSWFLHMIMWLKLCELCNLVRGTAIYIQSCTLPPHILKYHHLHLPLLQRW